MTLDYPCHLRMNFEALPLVHLRIRNQQIRVIQARDRHSLNRTTTSALSIFRLFAKAPVNQSSSRSLLAEPLRTIKKSEQIRQLILGTESRDWRAP